MTPSQFERFMAKVEKHDNGCWIWTASLQGGNYGSFHLTHTVSRGAHRVAYEHFVGPVPEGLVLDHLCRVRHCVNPEHLEPVTQRENQRRGICGVLTTHCKRGHEFTPENTYRHKGSRKCRRCAIDGDAYRRRQRRAQRLTLAVEGTP
jgi:hypothetical protein